MKELHVFPTHARMQNALRALAAGGEAQVNQLWFHATWPDGSQWHFRAPADVVCARRMCGLRYDKLVVNEGVSDDVVRELRLSTHPKEVEWV